jgi:hypothetical protein
VGLTICLFCNSAEKFDSVASSLPDSAEVYVLTDLKVLMAKSTLFAQLARSISV